MASIRSSNTRLEKSFKRLLDKNKLKGYKTYLKMFGNPDFVFPKKKIVVFIDGDFWHGYNWKKLGRMHPKKYWQGKIKKTIARDKKYNLLLKKQGWKVLRFWEHEIMKNPEKAMKKFLFFFRKKKQKILPPTKTKNRQSALSKTHHPKP